MLTIITNTLMGITMIAVIIMAVLVVGMVGSINDLYRQLASHQRDVNELLKVNNPQAYRAHKIKQENRIRRENGIPLVSEDDTQKENK